MPKSVGHLELSLIALFCVVVDILDGEEVCSTCFLLFAYFIIAFENSANRLGLKFLAGEGLARHVNFEVQRKLIGS